MIIEVKLVSRDLFKGRMKGLGLGDIHCSCAPGHDVACVRLYGCCVGDSRDSPSGLWLGASSLAWTKDGLA